MECLVLAKAGIPWAEIMEMDAVERQGWCVAAGTVEGGKFNWNTLAWEK